MIARAFVLTAVILSAITCGDYGSGTYGIVPPPAGAGAVALGFVVQPSNGPAGAAINPPVQVAIQNSSGATVTSSTATVTISLTPGTGTTGATMGGTVSRAAVSGVATFNNLTVSPAGTGYTLTATSTGLSSATSTPFAVTP